MLPLGHVFKTPVVDTEKWVIFTNNSVENAGKYM
jgi:hypothetical protein